MAWIQFTKHRDGTVTYWIRDVRDGISVVIDSKAGSRSEAEIRLERYVTRRDLEKEGYEDQHQDQLDKLCGTKQEILRKAGGN